MKDKDEICTLDTLFSFSWNAMKEVLMHRSVVSSMASASIVSSYVSTPFIGFQISDPEALGFLVATTTCRARMLSHIIKKIPLDDVIHFTLFQHNETVTKTRHVNFQILRSETWSQLCVLGVDTLPAITMDRAH